MKQRTLEIKKDFFERHTDLIYLDEQITKSIELIVDLKKENKILLCGNGGSAADCEHIAGELLKSFEALTSDDLPEVKLKEFVGHTPVQVLAGILLGAADAVLLHLVILR